ncbi:MULTISPECIES: hypothetical protein [unclassified Caballeronia]|uniref:hypothetical protein n=1 Tax=unclassified Caballeronia TaxID=2646786 RepID=UPI002865B7CA|nr:MULTISPECIES: hypothetical protein [unclassified Caballeronia]MDR5777330.1 hypothetical protein [Caballeronia sp. LZ002]MDR5852788.1 hypothetical protein [Caballeronia sp. LZ003]
MAVSKKQSSSGRKPIRNRQNKRLYLPLSNEHASQLNRQARIAFESIRTGRGDRAALLQMSSIVLLCEFPTEDGHGLLPLSLLQEARRRMARVMAAGSADETCEYARRLIDQLNEIVNEYDRQMRETRLHTIVAAFDKVDCMLVARKRSLARTRRLTIRLSDGL